MIFKHLEPKKAIKIDSSIPGGIDPASDSNVEMSWETFGGELAEVYEAILKQRCVNDGVEITNRNLTKYFRLHLNRGINHYSMRDVLKSDIDFFKDIERKADIPTWNLHPK